MKPTQLAILLPCQSLEDLGLKRSARDAEQLLAACTALWHPALLRTAGRLPAWFPADQPPADPEGMLLVVPDCSAAMAPDGWFATAESAGTVVLRGQQDRDSLITAALGRLDASPPTIAPALVADFLGLGFCYWMVELLTRKLRYMSTLDETSLQTELLAAADEAAEGNDEAARHRLTAAFDLLRDAREYFYPVEAHLVDLTLVAPTTLGSALRAELAREAPARTLLLSAETLQRMAEQEPTTLAALREAIDADRVSLVGGEFREGPLPLMPLEAIRRSLQRGLAVYEHHLGRRPTVFGRRRFGLSPVLPRILRQLGFEAALHFTLDDGRFPLANQSRIEWQGCGAASIEALARVPIDITRADSFLRLPEQLGDSMDLDYVSTTLFAHWPGQSSRWFEDFQRLAKYTTAFGEFTTLDEYFRQTALTGQTTRYTADEYRSPYLRQAVAAGQRDPISRWHRYYRRRATVEAAETLATMAALIGGPTSEPTAAGSPTVFERSFDQIDQQLEADDDREDSFDPPLQAMLEESLDRFRRALGRAGQSSHEQDNAGWLAANPTNFPQRVVAGEGGTASCQNGPRVVEVPPLGFAWVDPAAMPAEPAGPAKPARRRRKAVKAPPLAEENMLRNAYCEIQFDPYTGAIRGISDYVSRGPRLAQQVALRRPQPTNDDPTDERHYSIMVADAMESSCPAPMCGQMRCRGRLVDREARRLAGFVQTTRVWRDSRVIEVEIELQPEVLPDPEPWSSYYCARFAFNDATADLYRSVGLMSCPTDVVQVESPHFLDIRSEKIRTTLLCGGLPFHRRFGLRKLDTLLVVAGETTRRFRLGIGIDVAHPVAAGVHFLAPPTVRPDTPMPPAPSGWLFHIDARNVLTTHWEPIVAAGRVEGFRVRLLETDGWPVEVGLRAFRSVGAAEKHSDGGKPKSLAVVGDRIVIPLAPNEWAEVEARFDDGG